MKVLIIHHLEELWSEGYKQAGTSWWKLEYKFAQYLKKNNFDKVILTKFETTQNYFRNNAFGGNNKFYNDYPNIATYINEVYEYAYGWSYDELTNHPDTFVKGGNHSQAVLITDWIKELCGHEVYLSGAFLGECLEDMEIALKSQDIEPKYIMELCV
jgi:hypothetical protein